LKRPGEKLTSMPARISAAEQRTSEEVDAHERLLTDALRGDAMLFVREDAWKQRGPLLNLILSNATTLHQYETGWWGPREAGRLAVDVRGRHGPARPEGQ
jgi:glucose-6-phosphate 1-dehydrogenase